MSRDGPVAPLEVSHPVDKTEVPSPAGVRSGWRGATSRVRGPLRVLISGQALGQLGDGLAQISLAQLVLFDVGRGATPARIAGVLAVTLLPFSVIGPLAGVFIDRWNRKRTLVVTSWLRAGLAIFGIGAAITRSDVAAYVAVLLLLSSSRFVLDAKGAVLPRLVPAQELVRANAISGLIGMIAAFTGAVGGAMFVSASVSIGFLAAMACYLAASMIFGRLPFVGGGTAQTPVGDALHRLAIELGGGLRAVATTPDLRRPMFAVWTHRMLLGAGFVLLVLVADNRYHLTASGYGLALAITGVAAFAGTICAPWLISRWPPRVVLPLTFLPPAAAVAVAAYSPTIAGLMIAVGVTAVSFQCLKVLVDALVGRAAPDRLRGRVFALYDVLYNVSFVLAGLAMVPLWQLGRERALLWWLGAAFAKLAVRPGRGRRGAAPAVAHAGRRRGSRCTSRPRVPESRHLVAGLVRARAVADRGAPRAIGSRGGDPRLVGRCRLPARHALLAVPEHDVLPAGARRSGRIGMAALGGAHLVAAGRPAVGTARCGFGCRDPRCLVDHRSRTGVVRVQRPLGAAGRDSMAQSGVPRASIPGWRLADQLPHRRGKHRRRWAHRSAAVGIARCLRTGGAHGRTRRAVVVRRRTPGRATGRKCRSPSWKREWFTTRRRGCRPRSPRPSSCRRTASTWSSGVRAVSASTCSADPTCNSNCRDWPDNSTRTCW